MTPLMMLTRDELIELVLEGATDEIAGPRRDEILRPNILEAGCRRPLAGRTLTYPDPKQAARFFAGRIADRILDRLSLGEAAA